MLQSNRSGFTLIEIVIYLALFSLVIGGLLLVTYSIIQGTGRIQSKVVLDQEGEFLIQKFTWALSGASSVSVPLSSSIQITKPSLPPAEKLLTFSLSSGNLILARGSGTPVPLNSASVSVTSVTFTYNAAAGTARMQITLSAFSETQSFDVTRYLK